MMSLLSPGTFVGRWTLRSRREPRTAARVTCEVTGPGRVSLCVCALCVARRSGCVACRLSRADSAVAGSAPPSGSGVSNSELSRDQFSHRYVSFSRQQVLTPYDNSEQGTDSGPRVVAPRGGCRLRRVRGSFLPVGAKNKKKWRGTARAVLTRGTVVRLRAPRASRGVRTDAGRSPWRSRVRQHLRHLVHRGRERAACGVAIFGLLEVEGAFIAEPLHLGQQEVVHELARDRAGR